MIMQYNTMCACQYKYNINVMCVSVAYSNVCVCQWPILMCNIILNNENTNKYYNVIQCLLLMVINIII